MLGRKLALIFLRLLMGTNLDIQAEWLPTALNVAADDIYHLTSNVVIYDYLCLLTNHPSLSSCCQFQLSSTLLGLIWGVLWSNNSVDLLITKKLLLLVLGSLTSLPS